MSAPRESQPAESQKGSEDKGGNSEADATIVHFQTSIPTQDAVAIKLAEERLQ